MKKLVILFSFILVMFTLLPSISEASSYGWGFKKGTNHQPPEVGKYGQILEENGGYYIDKSGDKVVYLTFDNGYEQGYTEPILDVLKKEDVPATFFVTGHYVRSQPELVKRMDRDGHIIGNHSNHHADFTTLSKEEMKEDLTLLDRAVAAITDQEKLQYLRPPRGTFNPQTIQWANELGYTHVFWSLAFVDWETDHQKGWEKSYQQVMKQIHPGAVILLHTVSKDNAEAIEHFITDLRKQGYTFKSLDDLVLKNTIPEPIFGM
ncbi:delta-lactam-biosynthetic de-N-acetylase [Paraliobacillus quinghaiensis]|uniref:Delta-lactam-biosynthetic de-N-acetylase n=1 Tax=Paraliobacillus quinghaiensis TaxID=470815 RepID=A0A917TNC1_9BACI|nr:delta-lactam-biosynthetic de-N-acetylase [Paraliobacillus quinghaiensis]GGM30051.1 delta-lactam-biosynthetic de-N-acetylase [Paraliobacillus quinghaiensis]